MLSASLRKRLAGALALCMLSGLTLGCDDDSDRGHRPPPDRQRQTAQKPHPNGPRGPEAQRRDTDKKRPPAGQNQKKPPQGRPGEAPPTQQRRSADIVGDYTAQALNGAVVSPGTRVSVSVRQDEDGALSLIAPHGREYPISFDEDTASGTIAGGAFSLEDDGLFVYEDEYGGAWLVEPK